MTVATNKRPTTAAQRQTLNQAGFLRVDGLVTYTHTGELFYVIKADECDYGRYGHNNGAVSIITEGGEVWLADYGVQEQHGDVLAQLLRELTPKGSGAFVPLSNGENVDARDLLSKLQDSEYRTPVPASLII